MRKFLGRFGFAAVLMLAATFTHGQGMLYNAAPPAGYMFPPGSGTTTTWKVCSGLSAASNCTATPVFSDVAMANAISQPVTLASNNLITFFAPGGQYSLVYGSSSGGLGATVANLVLAADSSQQQVLLTGSAYTNATTTFSNVTGLAVPILASKNYSIDCHILWQGSAGTTGPKYQFTGPAAPTAVAANAFSAVTATTVTQASATAFASSMANAGTVTTATNFMDEVRIAVLNGTTAGTVQLQAAANGAGTLTIQPGSFCVATGL